MMDFLRVCISPWMLPYSIFFAVVMLYWIAMIIGAVDLDFLDFGADGVLDGAAEGAAEGAMDGALDGAGESGGGILASFLGFLSIGQIPSTIVLSVIIIFMWFFALLVHEFIRPVLGDTLSAWLMLPIFFGIFIVVFLTAAVVTALLMRPFRKYFVTKTQHGDEHLVGKTCIVKTSQVSATFGQAELAMRGAPLLLSVVCDEENGLAKGHEAVIVGFNKDLNKYTIRPLTKP